MNTRSRVLHAVTGMTLAFLVGVSAMAAGDKAHQAKPADTHAQPAAPVAAATGTYAPGLPGWINHLPADMLEKAKAVWLTEGRAILSTKEMVMAKRHELHATLTAPAADDKAVAALVKEISGLEEKLLNATIAFKRKLEKEGIPTWGVSMHMDGMGGAMGGMHGGMGEGKGMGMGKGMMMKMDHDGKSGQGHGGQGAAPAKAPAESGQHG